MEKPFLLHMFTPAPNVSPFDVNMAYDAGYQAVIPYTHVALDHIAALTQDCIFSRGPKGAKRSGIFIGGREIGLAADMLDAAKRAMVPPFEVSVFADPSGAFTTAAAMVASVEGQLKKAHGTDLSGKQVVILGGTGPVGTAAAVLASSAGAKVRIASHTSFDRARMTAEVARARYGADANAAVAGSSDERRELMAEADVVLATAKAGVQVLSSAELAQAKKLLVAADLNAVPPAGIEGLGVMDNGAALKNTNAVSIGDFRDAFELARKQVAA
jgi:methylene-tetrahydromethanopterin dehydrogenase